MISHCGLHLEIDEYRSFVASPPRPMKFKFRERTLSAKGSPIQRDRV